MYVIYGLEDQRNHEIFSVGITDDSKACMVSRSLLKRMNEKVHAFLVLVEWIVPVPYEKRTGTSSATREEHGGKCHSVRFPGFRTMVLRLLDY